MKYCDQDYKHSELTGSIIGAAQTVHRNLGPGLNEKIYENALCIELAELGINFSQQERFNVFYKSKPVGYLIPDLIIEDKVIVDTKVIEAFHAEHTAQIISYLNISKLELGLLINFKHASLKVKRIANTQSK